MKLMNDFIKMLNEFHKERLALEMNVLLRFTSLKSKIELEYFSMQVLNLSTLTSQLCIQILNNFKKPLQTIIT